MMYPNLSVTAQDECLTFKWLQCFGVYVSIRRVQSLEIIPELMAYITTVIRVNREYSGPEGRNYDVLFYKHATLRRDTK